MKSYRFIFSRSFIPHLDTTSKLPQFFGGCFLGCWTFIKSLAKHLFTRFCLQNLDGLGECICWTALSLAFLSNKQLSSQVFGGTFTRCCFTVLFNVRCIDAILGYFQHRHQQKDWGQESGGRAFMEGEKGQNTFIETSSELFSSKNWRCWEMILHFWGNFGMFSRGHVGSCLVGPSSILQGFFEWKKGSNAPRKTERCRQHDMNMVIYVI